MFRGDAQLGAGLFRLGAQSVPGAVQGPPLPLPALLRQGLRQEPRAAASLPADVRHRPGVRADRPAQRHRAAHQQLLPRLVRARQLLHFPHGSHPTGRMEAHIQGILIVLYLAN